jgi:hypothetical protein
MRTAALEKHAHATALLLVFLLVFLPVLGLAGGCSDPGGGGLRMPIPDSGQVFPNLDLQGIRSAAAADQLESISTWEPYDPEGLRYDLLHVMVVFLWCPHCNQETADVAKIATWQTEHRVAVLQIATQGYSSATPTLAELRRWAVDHDLTFPVLVDGQGEELGAYFSVQSVPVNIMVNPRTMAVLAIDVGEVGDVQAYEQGFLR